MQINLASWLKLSKKMGLDIVNKSEDNIAMGIWIYNVYGPEQWTTYKQYCKHYTANLSPPSISETVADHY